MLIEAVLQLFDFLLLLLDDTVEEDLSIIAFIDFKVVLEGIDEGFKLFDLLAIFQFLGDKVASEGLDFWFGFEFDEELGILFIEFEICINKLAKKHLIVLDERVQTGSSIQG